VGAHSVHIEFNLDGSSAIPVMHDPSRSSSCAIDGDGMLLTLTVETPGTNEVVVSIPNLSRRDSGLDTIALLHPVLQYRMRLNKESVNERAERAILECRDEEW
jgi:hypothetical protein